MHTNEGAATAGRRRRRHSDEFKAQAVAACRQPGVSMAAVAMAHGINANLLRRWVCQSSDLPQAVVHMSTSANAARTAFIPLCPPTAITEPDAAAREIRIDLQRGATSVKVAWPVNAASECAAWLRELLR